MKMCQTVGVTLLVWLAASGCSGPDDRLSELAGKALETQTHQNEQVIQATQELVEADAQARKAVLELQQELIAHEAKARSDLVALQQATQAQFEGERSRLDQQRDELEQERRRLAIERQLVSVLSAAINSLGLIIAAGLPLVLAWYVMRGVVLGGTEVDGAAVGELLTMDFAEASPRYLPTYRLPPRLTHEPDGDADAESTRS